MDRVNPPLERRDFGPGSHEAEHYVAIARGFHDAAEMRSYLAANPRKPAAASAVRAAKATYSDVNTCGECGTTGQYGAYCANCGGAMSEPKQAGKFCPSCGSELSGNRAEHVCSEVADDYRRRLTMLNFLEDVNGN
jgi:hypothetical protein